MYFSDVKYAWFENGDDEIVLTADNKLCVADLGPTIDNHNPSRTYTAMFYPSREIKRSKNYFELISWMREKCVDFGIKIINEEKTWPMK